MPNLHEWIAMHEILGDRNAKEYILESMKLYGFANTLRQLQRGRTKKPKLAVYTVTGGVVEVGKHGQVDAALETKEQVRLMVRNGRHDTALEVSEEHFDGIPSSSDQLLDSLANAGSTVPLHVICDVELSNFDENQRARLLPLLWKYIVENRQSNDCDELVGVGSAIRKYISIMPADRLGDLATMLAPDNHQSLPLELELEVVKMIYRNFEVCPPSEIDQQSELGSTLMGLVRAYIDPRILLRDKYSAVASLAIEAIVAMRSKHALEAWSAAIACPHRWFGEMVTDDLADLHRRWVGANSVVADWLQLLREKVLPGT